MSEDAGPWGPVRAAFVEVRIFLLEYPRTVLFDDLALTQD